FVPCPISTTPTFKFILPSLFKVIIAPEEASVGDMDVFHKPLIPFALITLLDTGTTSPSSQSINFLMRSRHAFVLPILPFVNFACDGVVSPGLMSFLIRNSMGSICSFSANLSNARSIANASSPCPYPRKDVAYGLFVYTQYASHHT